MDWLGKELGLTKMEDWYHKLNHTDAIMKGGEGLIRNYGYSPSKLLIAVYPQHAWDLKFFNNVPYGHWNIKENQRLKMDDIGEGYSNLNNFLIGTRYHSDFSKNTL